MFSIKETLRYGYKTAKENLEIILFSTLLILALSVLGNIGSGGRHDGGLGFGLFTFIITIFSYIVTIGYTKMFLRIHDGEKPKFVDIFMEYHLFWKYIGLMILIGLFVVVGFVFLVIPGIYIAIRTSFAQFILIDTKIGIIDSVKESWRITKDSVSKLLGFYIVLILLNLLGFIVLGIGLLITMPISFLAIIYVYRELSKQKAGMITSPVEETSNSQS